MLAGVRVLLLDDEPDMLATTELMLVFYEAQVVSVTSALEGLERLQMLKPDVIVSDIGMPLMDGYQFIREVRRLPSHKGGLTPALAFTAFNLPQDREKAIDAGFQKYLSKPVELQTLIDSVAGMAAQQRL